MYKRQGHHEGDKAIKTISNIFKSDLREIDIVVRMGGDEFLLVFPDSSLNQAPGIKNRLKEGLSLANKNIQEDYQITFSIGFSEYIPCLLYTSRCV